ncbi:MAG: DUF86 domain-containing protein [Deltaproteobacteria bacterium]|nr:DUF86 domain-containing protein [Deltaproteobacteria bacterium]
MARFRNLLVNQYWQIDYSLMYDIITGSDVGDLEELIRQINRWIRTEAEK